MEVLKLFGQLAPVVQLAVVVGTFATIFLIACNRTAATNLIRFLSDLYHLFREKGRPQTQSKPERSERLNQQEVNVYGRRRQIRDWGEE